LNLSTNAIDDLQGVLLKPAAAQDARPAPAGGANGVFDLPRLRI
jgi:hypothetical protein